MPSASQNRTGILLACSVAALAQTPLAFEVASIKRLETIQLGDRTVDRAHFDYIHTRSANPLRGISGNRFTIPFSTLTDLIIDAYNVRLDQISGAPRWASKDGDMYRIEAKAEGDIRLSSDQIRLMLQTLLADRFQLKLHRDTKNLSVYELTVAKNGPKIQEVPAGGKLPNRGRGGDLFLGLIADLLDYPLVDKTGLTLSNYQIHWDPTVLSEEIKQGFKPPPSIFSVVQDRLGLKLELKSGPNEVLVIDRAEKPSPN